MIWLDIRKTFKGIIHEVIYGKCVKTKAVEVF